MLKSVVGILKDEVVAQALAQNTTGTRCPIARNWSPNDTSEPRSALIRHGNFFPIATSFCPDVKSVNRSFGYIAGNTKRFPLATPKSRAQNKKSHSQLSGLFTESYAILKILPLSRALDRIFRTPSFSATLPGLLWTKACIIWCPLGVRGCEVFISEEQQRESAPVIWASDCSEL